MENSKKRKVETDGHGERTRKKSKKQWTAPKKFQNHVASIEPGDAGIWVTCEMHKEGKCTSELRDLFGEYVSKIHGDPGDDEEVNKGGEVDIETEIGREVEGMKTASKEALFQPVKIDVQCVLFFKTKAPIEPTSFTQRICSDAYESVGSKKTRFVQRLTPMTRMGKATEKGLQELSKVVLAPNFHQEGVKSTKFAIRTTIRNHHVLKRDEVIKQVATVVGDRHTVDLKNYDLLILVEIYRNICGMSVVGNDYERLKRFNLAEIYDPTPKPA